MKLIDTHCHIDFTVFDDDREDILHRCQQQNIDHIIVPGTRTKDWSSLLTLCDQHAMLSPALGLHPMFMKDHVADDIEQLRSYAQKNKLVAIGEIGLDFYQRKDDAEQQITLLEQQLEIAQDLKLPVIMHVRKAHDQILAALKKYPVCGGVIHAFNGSLQQAQHYIDKGFKLGFGGTLTYPNASKIHHLAQTLSLDDMVLETDAPDMSPSLHKGERNSPEYLIEILQALAILRDEDIEVVAESVTRNSCQVFGLSL